MRIETEKKYYCMQPESLIRMVEELNFIKIKDTEEIDEYFTDINSLFIKNRTCLRIRKKDNKTMQITYKGKSESLLGLYCKLENNIIADIKQYDNYVALFSSLGYYSYIEVVKKRMVYQLNNKNCKYNVMIDTLPEIGGFVEFEIISEQGVLSKSELKNELNNFIAKFDELKLNEATEPYRDIVAKNKINKIKNNKNILNLCINLDSELLVYEKDFYKKYKNRISQVCNYNIKWGEYKRNTQLDKKILPLINEYLDNLIFNNNDLLVTIELLNKFSYKKYFFTKVNETFCTSFFNKLNIKDQKTLYIKNNDTIISVLNKNCISLKDSIIINNNDFKENNSLLLVMITEL